jgi:hypothetical protein
MPTMLKLLNTRYYYSLVFISLFVNLTIFLLVSQ